MTTAPCPSCANHFNLRSDGTIREHGGTRGGICAGSGGRPEVGKVPEGPEVAICGTDIRLVGKSYIRVILGRQIKETRIS